MIFQGVLIACIINSNNTVPIIHTIICFVGITVSFYQMQAASGAKFWQEYWENEVNKAERNLKKIYESDAKDFHQLFDKEIVDVQKLFLNDYMLTNFRNIHLIRSNINKAILIG